MRVNGLRTATVRACASLILTALPAAASAGIIFTDGFGDGDRDNNGTAEATVTDATDVGLPWFKAGSGTSAMTMGAIDDSAGIGSGNALQLFNTGANNRPVQAHFAIQTLADGDSLIYSFDARVVSNTVTSNRIFRFGLYTDAGTFVTGDQGSADVSYNDDVGYNARVDVGADVSDNTSMDVTRDDSATGTVLAGTATSLSITSSNAANQIVDANKHHFELTLTRSGSGMIVSLQQDSNAAISGTDATPPSF